MDQLERETLIQEGWRLYPANFTAIKSVVMDVHDFVADFVTEEERLPTHEEIRDYVLDSIQEFIDSAMCEIDVLPGVRDVRMMTVAK